MTFFKQILDLFINTSILVGLAVCALLGITEIGLSLPFNHQLEIFVFLGTILGYNFLKYFPVTFKTSVEMFKQYLSVIVVSAFAFVGAMYFYFQLQKTLQIGFVVMAGLVCIYPYVRKYGVAKIIVVSFCVTAITAYLPVLSVKPITDETYLFVLQRFIIVICLLIPVEILDLKTDDKSLQTLPQKIGVRNTKIIGLLFLIFFVGLEFFKTTFSINGLLIALVTAIFIVFSSPNRSKYYASFWVESIPILWYGLLIFFTKSEISIFSIL